MKEKEVGVRERERGDLSYSLFGVGGLELRGVCRGEEGLWVTLLQSSEREREEVWILRGQWDVMR